jgi:hypothetical protein
MAKEVEKLTKEDVLFLMKYQKKTIILQPCNENFDKIAIFKSEKTLPSHIVKCKKCPSLFTKGKSGFGGQMARHCKTHGSTSNKHNTDALPPTIKIFFSKTATD